MTFVGAFVAGSHGISALVSPRGEVIASCDHVAAGPQMVTGDVAMGDGSVTMYARCGEWPVLGLCALLLALALRRRRG
jgi:apolipoprotein N-acyltransferase